MRRLLKIPTVSRCPPASEWDTFGHPWRQAIQAIQAKSVRKQRSAMVLFDQTSKLSDEPVPVILLGDEVLYCGGREKLFGSHHKAVIRVNPARPNSKVAI